MKLKKANVRTIFSFSVTHTHTRTHIYIGKVDTHTHICNPCVQVPSSILINSLIELLKNELLYRI